MTVDWIVMIDFYWFFNLSISIVGIKIRQQPLGGHQRSSNSAASVAMVECFSQSSAMVRLCHHSQVGDLAEPTAQPDRRIRKLLQHAGGLPLNASRHWAQRACQNGSAGTAT